MTVPCGLLVQVLAGMQRPDGSVDPRWTAFMKFQIDRAQTFFVEAESGVDLLSDKARWPVWYVENDAKGAAVLRYVPRGVFKFCRLLGRDARFNIVCNRKSVFTFSTCMLALGSGV